MKIYICLHRIFGVLRPQRTFALFGISFECCSTYVTWSRCISAARSHLTAGLPGDLGFFWYDFRN